MKTPMRHGAAVLLVLLLCASLFLVYNGSFGGASRDANDTRAARQDEQTRRRRRPTGAPVPVTEPQPPVLQGYSGIIDHQIGNQTGHVEGQCPVKLTSVRSQEPGGIYSECVTVRVWMKDDDFCEAPRIEILSAVKEIFRPTIARRKHKEKCDTKRKHHKTRVSCGRVSHGDTGFTLWELVHDCVKADAGSVVSVSYSTTSRSCNVSYTVPDPIPDFELSVDQVSKSITVTVEPGEKIRARWCYQKSAQYCMDGGRSRPITIDSSQSPSAVLSVPYLVPCVCVQVYYTYADARQHKKCPFQNHSLADVRDVFLSSKVTLFGSTLTWQSECPASDLSVSASLCWRQHEHLCTFGPNSTLDEKESGQHLIYSTSAVDKHPQMCVQFSLAGSHNISCPFQEDLPSWEAHMGLGWQSVLLHLTSLVPAKFSAQLCALNERECTPVGPIQSAAMDGNTTDMRMNVPLYSLDQKPCVQVWQSDPFLHGRRILCPDYTHKRSGIYAVPVLMIVIIAALLGFFIHRLSKSGVTGWLCIQNPVLLVCSSEQLAHVSAVFALASILQGELRATVVTALWALCLKTHPGARTGLADLGPLPWLYGQWEAVLKADGKVLIVWSPEANKIYEQRREERANVDKNERRKEDDRIAEARHEKMRVEMDFKLNRKGQRKYNKEKAAGEKHCCDLCDDKDPQREPSSVIAPVFMAALACLEGALQGRKGQGVVLVYFQGLCHSRDIPKALRGVPRYCLPQDFSGLIQELGGMSNFSGHCWPRLLSKVLSLWLVRQLAHRLQTLLPQRQGRKTHGPSVMSSQEMMADKTRGRLKLPPVANTAKPGTAPEHEPLCGAPQASRA